MNETTQKPSLEIDVDRVVLTGNRSGLEQLRETITLLLEGGGQSIQIDDGNVGIELVVLDESLTDQPVIMTWRDRVLIFICLGGVVLFLLVTLFGFYHLFILFI